MSSTVKKISNVETELFIEVPLDTVKSHFNIAYREVSRAARIPGFRKGRAPRAILRRMHGKRVVEMVQKEVIAESLQEAIQEHKLEPVLQPDVNITGEINENEIYKFSAKLEVQPKIEKLNFEGIEIKSKKINISDDDIMHVVNERRNNSAEIINLKKPRPAKKSDIVSVEARNWIDGNWSEKDAKKQDYIIDSKYTDEKIIKALTGASVGDEVVLDKGKTDKMDRDRERQLLKVLLIKGRRLPKIDDELAKDNGDYETLDDWKKDINKNMEKAVDDINKRMQKEQLFAALREKNEMEIPKGLLDSQTYAIQMNMLSQNMSKDNPVSEEEQKKILEDAKESATKMLHHQMLMMEIGRLENIKVEDSDLEAEFEKLAKAQNVPVPMIKAEFKKDKNARTMEMMMNNIFEDKVFALMIPRVKVIEEEIEKPAAKKSVKSTKTTKKTVKKEPAAKKKAVKKVAEKTTKTGKSEKKTIK